MAEPYGRTDTTVATTSWANASSKGNTAKPQDMKSRNTYIEVKLTSEQWWVLLFVVWIAISFVLITKAIMHNVTTGWHCPRNCDAFLTPFALSIATCVVPVFFCCPVLGAKGVWWLRPGDDPTKPWRKKAIDRRSSSFEHATIALDLDEDGKQELYVASDNDGQIRRYVWNGRRLVKEVIYEREGERSILTWNIMPIPLELAVD